jgi:hypothetical protein
MPDTNPTLPSVQHVPIGKIKPNPSNPRIIKDDKFKKLVASLHDFPEMSDVRPLVVNLDMIVLGGNMRLKAMKEAGWTHAPIIIVDWASPKQRDFILKDNSSFGEWDWEMLANEWNPDELKAAGIDIPAFDPEHEEFEGNYPLATELKSRLNYIVLTFDNDTDWKNAQTTFGLETVKTKRPNGKDWSRGVGRVLKGADALQKILTAHD